jgi:D-isomer specific 2-hydroxyacid dehydrogenase-like protein
MKPKVLVTREVFDETLEFLAQHCDVDSNQGDVALDPEALALRLAAKSGLMCALTDRVDARLIARCPDLKAVANIAVGYNNIDLPACTARGIMATNTPGVLGASRSSSGACAPANGRAGASSNGWAWMCITPRSAFSAWGASARRLPGAPPASR